MSVEMLNPDGLSTPTTYSQVAVATGSRIVYVAGQVALDEEGNLVGEGDVVAQARQIYVNLATALAAVGAKPSDVVKLNSYVVNHRAELLPALSEVRRQAFGDHFPASTLAGVQALARPEFLIEVEAIAILD